MGINGVGSNASLMVQSLVTMRSQLGELQRQLGTGTKSDTYAGMGLDRGLAVGLRAQLSALNGYTDTITTANSRIDLAQTVLTRIYDDAQDVRSATKLSEYTLDNTGQTPDQKIARVSLDSMLGLLNTQFGDRYLFAGRAVDKPAVESGSHVLDGDGARAGLRQIIDERTQADLGTGTGRLLIPVPPPAGTTVTVAEDVAGSPFGLKLAGVTSNFTNATVSGPAGAPPSIGVDFAGGNPNPGETIKFTFTLPDGSKEDVSLRTTSSATPGPGDFTIGATPADTATNLQAALATAVGKLSRTSLSAASAMVAADEFFNIDAANPPQRVAGPPFASATALVAGTSANTVSWYTGEAGSDPARTTATARVDQLITVGYGIRANEQAIRWAVQQVAVFAAVTSSASNPDGADRYTAISQRVSANLDAQPGMQRIVDITSDLASAQATMQQAKQRHVETQSHLKDMLQHIEGVPQEQVAAEILALNTRLQASLQTTAMLYQTSLVNYL